MALCANLYWAAKGLDLDLDFKDLVGALHKRERPIRAKELVE